MKLGDLIVSPCNVREDRENEDVASLTDSIKKHSLISKLVLRSGKDGKFEVVAGQRRFKALQAMYPEDYMLKEDEYLLYETLDDQEAFLLSLQENQNRVPLSPLELNRAALKLNNMGWKDKKIAAALNVTPYRVKRLLALSQNLSRLPEEAKVELSKPLEESKFNDAHVLKISDLDDSDVIRDVVDNVIQNEVPPKDVPKIVKAVKKQYDGAAPGEGGVGAPGEVNPSEPVPDGPIEYSHKGELKLELHGDKKILKVIGKGEDEEVPLKQYVEYLKHPEKFRCQINFKLKVKPLD